MDDVELREFEAELRQIRPAPLAPGLAARLAQAPQLDPLPSAVAAAGRLYPRFLKWLVPSAAAAAAVVLATAAWWRGHEGSSAGADFARGPAIRADEVYIDRELVTSFQTVAESPEGLPIRFELQEWMEHVTFRDTRRGVTVRQTAPRVEIVPIYFESY